MEAIESELLKRLQHTQSTQKEVFSQLEEAMKLQSVGVKKRLGKSIDTTARIARS